MQFYYIPPLFNQIIVPSLIIRLQRPTAIMLIAIYLNVHL